MSRFRDSAYEATPGGDIIFIKVPQFSDIFEFEGASAEVFRARQKGDPIDEIL